MNNVSVYFQFPQGWWVILALIYLVWLILFFQRQSYKNEKEIKVQFLYGVITIIIALIVEFVAVSLNVWMYFPGNWPVVLWVGYFGAGLLSYQLVKYIEEKLK